MDSEKQVYLFGETEHYFHCYSTWLQLATICTWFWI